MARHSQGNALYNARFKFWDYAESLNLATLPSIPYASNRWKVAASGGITGTITKGTGPSGITIPKWLRSQTAFQLNLTGVPVGSDVTVTQYVEDANLYGQTFAVLSTVHSGPAGATIYVGIGDDLKPVALKGSDVLVSTTHAFLLGDFAVTEIPVKVFSNPDLNGTYKIHYAQLALGLDKPRHNGFIVRPDNEDRTLCNRYAYRLLPGISGPATATRVSVALSFPTPMRANPTLTNVANSITVVDIASGAGIIVNPPTVSMSNPMTTGARFAITGMTGLTVGSTQIVTAGQVAVLHADF